MSTYLVHGQIDARVRQNPQQVGHVSPVEDLESLAAVQLAAAVQDARVLVGVAQRHPRLHNLHGVDEGLRDAAGQRTGDEPLVKLQLSLPVAADHLLDVVVGAELERGLGGDLDDVHPVSPPQSEDAPLFYHVPDAVDHAHRLAASVNLRKRDGNVGSDRVRGKDVSLPEAKSLTDLAAQYKSSRLPQRCRRPPNVATTCRSQCLAR